jgi:hypothetical protein
MRRCAALANAHIFLNMLRLSNRRAPCLASLFLFFNSLPEDGEN